MPSANSPIDPSCLITLWHGINNGTGFNLQAVPTALDAPGEPMILANDL